MEVRSNFRERVELFRTEVTNIPQLLITCGYSNLILNGLKCIFKNMSPQVCWAHVKCSVATGAGLWLQQPLCCPAHTESTSIAAYFLLGSAVQGMVGEQRRNFVDFSNIIEGQGGEKDGQVGILFQLLVFKNMIIYLSRHECPNS